MEFFAERFQFPGAQVLHHATAGNTTTYVGYLPANGNRSISVLCSVYLGAAADVVINIKTADDSSGTSATALTESVPIWIEGTRQTDGTSITIPSTYDTAASYTAVFQVPAILVPEDKYIGIYLTAGNASNILYALAIENQYYKG